MKTDLHLRAPDPAGDLDAMADLFGKCFPWSGYWRFADYCRNGYVGGRSFYDWRTSRVGLVDGAIVTHFGVWDYQTRVRAARLRTAGIGVVATDGRFRKRGLMDRTVAATIPAMRAAGYDVSILFGIGDFYHRFGYARAWPEAAWTVAVDRLPTDAPAARTFDLPAEPRADLARLYNRQYATTTGTAVRPTFATHTFGGYFNRALRAWGASAARVAGYVIHETDKSRLTVLEAVGDAATALRVTAALARERRASEVRFVTLPHRSDLARLVRAGDAKLEVHYQRSGGAMVRVINLAAALAKLAPVLTDRLASSAMAGWNGSLLVANADDAVTLTIGGGRVAASPAGRSKARHAIRGGSEVGQLLLGADDPTDLTASAHTRLTGDARRLLPVLFPAEHPVLHAVDGY